MRIVQTHTTTNTTGYMNRLEHGFAIKRETLNYLHVKKPVYIAKPQIDDISSLIVVHDKVEQYV